MSKTGPEIRKEIVELLVSRMNGIYELEYLLNQAAKVMDYIESGAVPVMPILQAPQPTPPSAGAAGTTTQRIRDYVKRP